MPDSNKRVKGTLHWVSVAHSVAAEVRLYDRLFKVENPADEKDVDFHDLLNPDSLTVLQQCYVEKELLKAKPLDHFQFQRIGYFNLDPDSKADHLVFNQTVSLKDTWSKISNKK